MTKLRSIDMFSGIGGMSLGLHRTGGFETVAAVEIDPYASKVFAKHFPGVPNLGDVTTAEYPDADFICAGFPCQDISFAGLGAGLAGERSGLWREVVRAIRVVRPRGTLLENVAALLGRGLDTVLGDLAEVRHDAEWHCIPAAAVGAPHRRDRIWIATHPRGEQHEGSRPPLSGSLAAQLSQINSDAESERRSEAGGFRCDEPEEWPSGLGEALADPNGAGLEGRDREELRERPGEWPVGPGSASVANAAGSGRGQGNTDAGGCGEGTRAPEEWQGLADRGWWVVEPNVGRVANGIPKRVDRLRCLGNAVVPQIPELIGNAILASLAEERRAA